MSSEAIMAKQTRMPRIGTSGTNGVLYGRGISGCVRRMIMTPTQTITNASSVPMLVMSPRLESGTKPGEEADEDHEDRLERHGVRNFG